MGQKPNTRTRKSVFGRIIGLVALVGIGAPALYWAYFQFFPDPELPLHAECHLGGYRLPDQSVFGLTPRSSRELRIAFMSGETAVLTEQAPGIWQTAEGRPAYKVALGDCGGQDPQVTLPDGTTTAAKKIAYGTTDVRFDGVDGLRAGRLFLPENGVVKALLIGGHGSERSSGIVGGRMQALMPAHGIAVFAYDKRGTGASEGSYTQDFYMLSDDMVLALKEARRLLAQASVPSVPAGFYGPSQGGWIAPLAMSKSDADFVIAAYGLAEGALAEDRDEVMYALRQAGYGDDVLAKAREVTDATGKIMATRFKEGFEELAALKEKYGEEEWFDRIEGEFSGSFVSTPGWILKIIGSWFDVGTSWDYDPIPTLRSIDGPMLWVLGGKDRVAPNARTIEILKDLQQTQPDLDMVIFPNAGHGIRQVSDAADGTRTYGDWEPDYFPLLRDWILTGEIPEERGIPTAE